jgi:hypothetical protein
MAINFPGNHGIFFRIFHFQNIFRKMAKSRYRKIWLLDNVLVAFVCVFLSWCCFSSVMCSGLGSSHCRSDGDDGNGNKHHGYDGADSARFFFAGDSQAGCGDGRCCCKVLRVCLRRNGLGTASLDREGGLFLCTSSCCCSSSLAQNLLLVSLSVLVLLALHLHLSLELQQMLWLSTTYSSRAECTGSSCSGHGSNLWILNAFLPIWNEAAGTRK